MISKNNFTNDQKDAIISMHEIEDSSKSLEKSILNIEADAFNEEVALDALRGTKIATFDVTLVIGGTRLIMNSIADADATLTDILAAVKVKVEENKLRKYLRNKYQGKLSIDAFSFETGMNEQRCRNCHKSLNDEAPAESVYWFSVEDTILILMMLK